MAEIDPVIFEFKARVDGYLSSVKRATDVVDQNVGRQEKRIKQLEREIMRSNGAIAGSFRTLAGSLAAYFSAQQIGAMVDGFTRVQNSLRVAGLEGQNLEAVQKRLLDVSGQYGVSLEALADLYGKSAQSATELGASQGQLLQLTTATAQALKISGTGAAQASGAILGLSQALAGGTVRAEEFNQINEGGLRPLLQAAAASQRWGGSVAKLRADVLDGKVSSQEFFQAIMDGSRMLEGTAAKSTLTLAGAFQSLSDKLMVYVGSAASANGVTGALATGIQGLANNLDTIAEALAVIGVVLAGRYVGGMVAAAGATTVTSGAVFALQARMAGAATTAEALAFAGAGAGRALLAAFGGPVGIAVTALTLGIGYLMFRTQEASQAAREKENADLKMAEASKVAAAATDQLANASEKERKALIASMQASRERAAQALQTAQAQIVEAKAALEVARANAQKQRTMLDSARMSSSGLMSGAEVQLGTTPNDAAVSAAEAKLADAERKYAIGMGALQGLDRAISNATRPVALSPAGGGSKGAKGGKGKGNSAEDRYADEMARLAQEELRARADLTTNAADRADLEKQMLEGERAQRIAQIENEESYTRAQKDAQIAAINRIYGKPAQVGKNGEIIAEGRPGLLAQQINRELEFRQNQIAMSALEAQQATLEAQADLETNLSKRNDLERRALDLRQKIERARLDEAIATEGIAESARAELLAQQNIERLKLARSQRSPGQVYRDDLREAAGNINDAIESIEVRGLNALNDGITEAIMGTKSLGDVFKNVANQIIADLIRIAVQQAIVRPIAEALFGGGSSKSSGGFLGIGSIISTIAGLPGRAGGGHVQGGQMYRVNEGASAGRVEAFIPQGSGTIIPLGQMNAAVAGGGATVVQHFHLDARGAVMTQDIVNQINSMGQRAAEAGARGGHALAQRDLAQMRRPKL